MRVDDEFRALIPPLQDEELRLLEQSIVDDGCREPLAVWAEAGILLDGHNRYDICTRLGLPYEVRELSFDSRESAFDWMDRNQLGRRNLTPLGLSMLRGRIYERAKKSHGGDRNTATVQEEPSGQNGHLILDEAERTRERLAVDLGVGARTIARDAQLVRAVDTLKPTMPDIVQRVMSGDVPSKQAVIEAAKQPERAAELLKPHVAHNSGENEWYTPSEWVELARKVMGGIDCDPASSAIANQTVKAAHYWTAEDDGREREWGARVWMNPPYAQPLISDFCRQLAARVISGEVSEAVVLVNNATETAWFQRLMQVASAVCFPRSRIRFFSPDGMQGAPLQGQAVIYCGPNAAGFIEAAKAHGACLAVA
jgi:ParB family chromosome partitioning protein